MLAKIADLIIIHSSCLVREFAYSRSAPVFGAIRPHPDYPPNIGIPAYFGGYLRSFPRRSASAFDFLKRRREALVRLFFGDLDFWGQIAQKRIVRIRRLNTTSS
jgi:hypothetical protein